MTVRSFYRLLSGTFTSSFRSTLFVAAAMAVGSATSAMADLALTQAGLERGYELSTFATGFSPGPTGIDFLSSTSVMVSNTQIRLFQNIDNQSAAAVPPLTTYTGNNTDGLAHVGSNIYMTQYDNGRVVQINANGTFNHSVVSLPHALGIVPHPSNGHVFVGSGGGSGVGSVIDLDPLTGAFTTISNQSCDGVSVSADGSVVYAALTSGSIVGYNVSTHAVVFNSGVIPGVVDGTALGFGGRLGLIYANTNGGSVWQISLSNPLDRVEIANGGTRGDFVTADPFHPGELLVTQSDRIMRLKNIPAPSTAALLGLGGLLASRRRR